MKKSSTVAIERIQIFKEHQLTIGLDLGDRTSHYCILNEAGEVILESKLPTTPKGIEEVFSRIPRSRIALETGTHSPWVSRQLTQLGHEVIVAHARNVRLIGDSSRKDDQLDARTLARLARIDPGLLGPVRHRSAKAQIHLTVIRARAALVSVRTALVNAARGLTKSYGERLRKCGTEQMRLKFVALRYFNAAGATENNGEDHRPESHLIPNALSAALGQQDAIRVFGNNYPTLDGTPVRDYIHVAELADAHFKALQYLRQGGTSESLNLGTGQGYSVLEVIERVREITGQDVLVRMEAPRPGDPACLVANAERAKAVLGWNPTASDLHSIVRSAWEWRLRHPEGYAD